MRGFFLLGKENRDCVFTGSNTCHGSGNVFWPQRVASGKTGLSIGVHTLVDDHRGGLAAPTGSELGMDFQNGMSREPNNWSMDTGDAGCNQEVASAGWVLNRIELLPSYEGFLWGNKNRDCLLIWLKPTTGVNVFRPQRVATGPIRLAIGDHTTGR